jgi:hypothetical protein
MIFQAPAGVTALFSAGETMVPDESGLFDAAPSLARALAAHGCVPRGETEPSPLKKGGESQARGNRARVEKAD